MNKKFKPGQIIDSFNVNGKKVVFRTIKLSDIKGITRLANSLIEERAYLAMQKKVSKKKKAGWVRQKIRELKENSNICIIAEVDGKIAGSAEVWNWDGDSNRHVSEIEIALGNYRSIGLGTKMMMLLEKIARKNLKSKVMVIQCVKENKIALGLYKKRGFVKTGRFPRVANQYGRYTDEISLSKALR